MSRRQGIAVRFLVGWACLLLLGSPDLATVTAPLTLPLLWWAGWTAITPAGRFLLDVLAVAVATWTTFTLVEIAFDDASPLRVWLPLVVIAAVLVAYPLTQRRYARPTS